MWISWVEDFGYSWRVNPQGLTGNPFQYIQNLYPIDSSAVNDYILGKSGHSMYIFTFDTKLRIQTYDGSKKEIIHTEYCSYKRRPSIDPIYWIDFPEYKFILRLDESHDYTTKLILSMEGIPSFKSDEKEHTWMTSVNSDIMSCGNGSVDFNLRPYTENGMKEMVEDMWMNIRAGSEEEKMIQLLTFGDSLRVQTYNVLQRKVVRTATYKYERIKKRIYSMRVFLPDEDP